MTERIDEVSKHYSPIETCEMIGGYLFWVCVFLSFFILIPTHQLKTFIAYAFDPSLLASFKGVPNILFIVTTCLYFSLSQYVRFFLIPRADKERLKQLLTNSFGTSFSVEKTAQYYNNSLPTSMGKLAANILENSLFGKEICAEMAKKERKKVGFYALIYLFLIFNRSTDISVVIALSQLLFSEELLIRLITVEFLRSRLEIVHDGLYAMYRHNLDLSKEAGFAEILNFFALYESAKASAGLKQSSAVFFQLNPLLTQKWLEIKKQLKIDPDNNEPTTSSII